MDRNRLIAGLAAWASARPHYRLKLGSVPIPFSALTDEALSQLRTGIASDIRSERRRQRENRAVGQRAA